MEKALVVMAAGMGSRYGGNKQWDRVGPGGEMLLEYSIYDAILAGFNKVVFVVSKGAEKGLNANGVLMERLKERVTVEKVYQELDKGIPEGFEGYRDRRKPWGTGHAVLMAVKGVDGPFAVINADDYYGRSAFKELSDFFSKRKGGYCLVGYRLKNTLSSYGGVSRGICQVSEESNLLSIEEYHGIKKEEGFGIYGLREEGQRILLTGDEVVSLNLWGFERCFFKDLRDQFEDFLAKKGEEREREFYLPEVVKTVVKRRGVGVKVLDSEEHWFGMTYREDRKRVEGTLKDYVDSGEYPKKLWE